MTNVRKLLEELLNGISEKYKDNPVPLEQLFSENIYLPPLADEIKNRENLSEEKFFTEKKKTRRRRKNRNKKIAPRKFKK